MESKITDAGELRKRSLYTYTNQQIHRPDGSILSRYDAGLLIKAYGDMTGVYKDCGVDGLLSSLREACAAFDRDLGDRAFIFFE